MGAIASPDTMVLNDDVLRRMVINPSDIDAVVVRERREMQRREQAYRGARPKPDLRARTVILVDDGLATGATMRAAILAVRAQGPEAVVVAVPVAPAETISELSKIADRVYCSHIPDNFTSIGYFYDDFGQVQDNEVKQLLHRAWSAQS